MKIFMNLENINFSWSINIVWWNNLCSYNSNFYSENEINNKLDDLVSYYLAYCLITLFTGISITNKYEDHTLPKNSKKKNSLQIDVKEKKTKK